MSDINKNDFFLSISNVEKNITKRTKAIIPVHIYGQVCNIDEVLDVARENNLKIIEDCAHAIGTFHNSKHVGTCLEKQVVFHFTLQRISQLLKVEWSLLIQKKLLKK